MKVIRITPFYATCSCDDVDFANLPTEPALPALVTMATGLGEAFIAFIDFMGAMVGSTL